MSISVTSFGMTPQGEASLYTITNSKGMSVGLSSLGAAIVQLNVPDAAGRVADVVLGFDDAAPYMGNGSFFGVVVGPSANRIAGATFDLDGQTYPLDDNDGGNNLHSHMTKGYHKCLWAAETSDNSVTFSLEDADGNMGFPGNKKIAVTYTLDDDNALTLHYHAASDKNTILNPTNHSYFNLNGHNNGNIEGHTLQMNAACYTPTVPGSIPTGEIAPVTGTVMDFTAPKVIGLEIETPDEQLIMAKGYDHNWVIDNYDGSLKEIATVTADKSSRVMKVYTNLPGVQFYAGNCIAPETGKGGALYDKRSGLCLETQFYPDSIHQPAFPSCVFGGEKEYDSVTVYQFLNQ